MYARRECRLIWTLVVIVHNVVISQTDSKHYVSQYYLSTCSRNKQSIVFKLTQSWPSRYLCIIHVLFLFPKCTAGVYRHGVAVALDAQIWCKHVVLNKTFLMLNHRSHNAMLNSTVQWITEAPLSHVRAWWLTALRSELEPWNMCIFTCA